MLSPAEDLLRRLRKGEPRALARACRLLDELSSAGDDSGSLAPVACALQEGLHKDAAPATWTIGITGSPGAGKSTLADALVVELRAVDLKCCVLAIDPSSPFSGGAMMGDRIRMQRHSSDPGVFIRSLATRGALGGLSRSCRDLQRACAVWGADVTILETVGVGQDELDVIAAADTTCVVVAPGMGDDVQASKAGIMEVADALVVNKCDLPGAARTVADMRGMLALSRLDLTLPLPSGSGGHRANVADSIPAGEVQRDPSPSSTPKWVVPLIECSSERSRGAKELLSQLEAHRTWLKTTVEGRRRSELRRLARSRKHLLDEVSALLLQQTSDEVDALTQQLAEGVVAPAAAAERLLHAASTKIKTD